MQAKSISLLGCAVLFASFFTAQAQTNFFHFRTPHSLVCRSEENISTLRAAKPEWLKVFVGSSTNTMELGNRIAIQLKSGADLKKLTAGRASKLARTVAPDVFILQAPDAVTAMLEAEAFAKFPEVLASYPVMRRRASLDGAFARIPNDPYFYTQWNMGARNPDGTVGGPDLNIRAAWPFTRGEGITVAVADIGVELNHLELVQRGTGAPHFNFLEQSTNGRPGGDSVTCAHGTEVAGLIVAEANNGKGIVGVAPKANLASWVIFTTNELLVSDEQLMDMFQFASNSVAVQNHSWGNPGVRLDGPSLLEQIGISNALTHGRFGRGVIMIRSAGNDRTLGANCNDDGYPSDPRVIAVAAIRQDYRIASYSEPGACILLAAPSGGDGFFGLFSTDLLGLAGADQVGYCPQTNLNCETKDLSDYVFDALGFSGTSAAAPQVAGVAVLMLSANTNLTYRDVQQILLLSARQFDFGNPDLITNGAGFKVSHLAGFGVPDAGVAVGLARSWSNHPPATTLTFIQTNWSAIPDQGLRLLTSGDGVPTNSIRTLPSTTGIQPDLPTAVLPLVEVGQALTVITQNLSGKAALIQRGGDGYPQKINRAAQAGAAFAIVYNLATASGGCPGGEQLCAMTGTDYLPIPAVFIGFTAGNNLKNLLQQGTNVLAQLKLETTNYSFVVTNQLISEHVGVRIKTDHPLRGDLRMTLVSPQGTRSILQRFNGDTSPGPVDWTYFSTHHFFESSAGTWTVSFNDQIQGNVGNVQSVSLILNGVAINDNDADGLDDGWENANLGSLAFGAKDDPDLDGYSNAREQIMQTNPNVNEVPFKLDVSFLDQRLARLSWPSSENFNYEIRSGTNVAALGIAATIAGKFPETEWLTPYTNSIAQFFQIRAVPKP